MRLNSLLVATALAAGVWSEARAQGPHARLSRAFPSHSLAVTPAPAAFPYGNEYVNCAGCHTTTSALSATADFRVNGAVVTGITMKSGDTVNIELGISAPGLRRGGFSARLVGAARPSFVRLGAGIAHREVAPPTITTSTPSTGPCGGCRMPFTFAVYVPASSTCASIVTLQSFALASNGTGTTAGDAATSANLPITVECPEVQSVMTNPGNALEGRSASGTITLDAPAGPDGLAVQLSSSTASVTVPATVLVAAGARSATFQVNGIVPGNAAIKGKRATSASTVEKQVMFIVRPIQVRGVALNPRETKPGTSVTGLVTLEAPAPAGGIVVTVRAVGSGVTVPAQVTVPAGASTASFTATVDARATTGTTTVEALRNTGASGSALTSGSVAAATISSTTLSIKP